MQIPQPDDRHDTRALRNARLAKDSIEELHQHASLIDERGEHQGVVLRLADDLLGQADFQQCSGSSNPRKHHYGDYGLIIHTCEVVITCLATRELYPRYDIDEAELFLAALYHDAGKVRDHKLIDIKSSYDGVEPPLPVNWAGTKHRRYIHHIPRSAIIWSLAMERLGEADSNFKDKYEDPVLHAILSHHGRREWGSPVAPKSRVAWLLHLCDTISARMYDADTMDVVPGG